MSVETALRKKLIEDPSVRVLTTNVYPLLIPQHLRGTKSKQPCIVYQRVGTSGQATTCGTDDLYQASVQYDSYSPEYDKARELSKAVRACLLSTVGLTHGVQISKILYNTDFDVLEPDVGLFRVSQMYTVFFVE